MRAAEQWAKDAVAAWQEAVRSDVNVLTGFQKRLADLARRVQLDTVSQCARVCRVVGNDSRPRERASADRCLDEIANLAVSLTREASGG